MANAGFTSARSASASYVPHESDETCTDFVPGVYSCFAIKYNTQVASSVIINTLVLKVSCFVIRMELMTDSRTLVPVLDDTRQQLITPKADLSSAFHNRYWKLRGYFFQVVIFGLQYLVLIQM